MKRYYTKKEVAEQLKNIKVICDTREQVNHNITEYLDAKKIPHISRKLDVGDYSFMVDDYTFENSVVIERKANLDELAGNVTADRSRFENEFLRAKANNVKVFLLIENASWQDIKSHNYRSKLKPKSMMATLLAWQTRYNLTVMFCKPTETAEIIYATFYYWFKNWLEHGG